VCMSSYINLMTLNRPNALKSVALNSIEDKKASYPESSCRMVNIR